MSEAPGLYVHVPFCAAVCPYCDFAVRTGAPAARARYVASLLDEIALHDPSPWAACDTLYLGGGTPSLLEPEQLARIVEALVPFAPVPWIFLEANPEDVTPQSAAAWRATGVRTLSLGVQSLDAAALEFLGRRHSPTAARAAVETALAAGFDTVSLDLIYGLPGQTASAWTSLLEQAAALGVQHLSCYQLTVHEGTPLFRRRMPELPEHAQAELFLLTHERLAALGFEPYEVSNFARAPEHRSRHNVKYWNHTPYLGLGPAAHSFDGRRRWWNERALPGWRAALAAGRLPVAGEETLRPPELALEALLLGLRTTEGIALDAFRARHGVDLLAANPALVERCVADGQLVLREGRLAPTPRGLAIADGLAARFALPDC